METVSLKEFCKDKGIVRVSTIYASKDNDYPMLALEKNEGDPIHLMLTRNAGEKWPVGTNPKEFANDASVTTFHHEQLGETVSRLSTGSTSVGVDELFD